jgi:hypothetical protein
MVGLLTIVELSRWAGRLLDPRAHPSIGPGAVSGATAYAGDGMILGGPDPGLRQEAADALSQVATAGGYRYQRSGSRVRLVDTGVGPAVDPWSVKTWVARTHGPEVAAAIGLDHLLTMAEQPGGNPFAIGHGSPGLDHYGDFGYPGRGPVFLPMHPPLAGAGTAPRVLLLDTEIGDHPWFRAHPACTRVDIPSAGTLGPRIGDPARPAVARDLVGNRMLGSLGTDAGHGTFIAGLLRQACPGVDIVALAVMGSDGIVAEHTLTQTLTKVLRRVTAQPGWLDALVLSLGYYAETAEDLSYTALLQEILIGFGRAGVAVFCAAGNDATSRPSYPAAFAAAPAYQDPAVLPLLAVGALNADGSTAVFSNRGPWVNAWAPGVGVVSTVPVTARGSERSNVGMTGVGGRRRAALDPDDFEAGFASWSGTSFAAPILAARYLQSLSVAGRRAEPSRRRELLQIVVAERGAGRAEW